jgi:hypothetical protein
MEPNDENFLQAATTSRHVALRLSAIFVDSAGGYHDLRIDGATFAAGAPSRPAPSPWPGAAGASGTTPTAPVLAASVDHVSLYIALDEAADARETEVTALFGFTLVAEKRRTMPFCLGRKTTNYKEVASGQMVRTSFGSEASVWGYETFVARDAMFKLVAGPDNRGASYTSFTLILVPPPHSWRAKRRERPSSRQWPIRRRPSSCLRLTAGVRGEAVQVHWRGHGSDHPDPCRPAQLQWAEEGVRPLSQ